MTAHIDRDFRSALKWSIGAHAVLGFALIFKGIFFPSEPLRIEDAIRVDLIALPDKMRSLPMPEAEVAVQVPPQVQAEPVPGLQEASKAQSESTTALNADAKVLSKTPSKPDPKVDLSAKKKTQAQSLQRLKALERLEEMARKEAAAKALAQLKAQPLKGNQISTGNSLSGLTRLDHNRYLNSVEMRVKQNWRPPKFLAKSKLKLRVLIRISSTGEIISKSILASSGNGVFDESAIVAIDQSAPLPVPPESLQAILENQGLEIELDPNAAETL